MNHQASRSHRRVNWEQRVLRFLHRGLGLKNLVDFIQMRRSLLGLTHLEIRTVLDVGANKGLTARAFRKLFPNATVYCIEPIPTLCERLERWARTQGGTVRVVRQALAAAPSESTLYIDQRNDIWSTLRPPSPDRASGYETIQVRVNTLDTLATELDLADDILIKIDAEGLDLEVIQGGPQTLRRAAAVIVESVFYPNPVGEDAPTFEDIATALRQHDYVYRGNVRIACDEGTPMLADVLFVRRDVAVRLVQRP